ncbi:hypothetical protein LAV82_22825 [Bacillus sp. ILBB4]|nr:hypothetical protein [Bacillus sp. ILBB4]
MCSNKKDTITEPIQRRILYKVDAKNLANIAQSIPISEETTALSAYYRYVFLVEGNLLIKRDTHPELEIVKTVEGYHNTKLMAGADGQHIFVIKDGKLIKLNFELEPVPVPDGADDSGWEDARLMTGAGDNLYIVKGDELIKVDGKTLKVKQKSTGWADATSLGAPGNSSIYLFRNNGELIRLKESNLEVEGKSEDWKGTTLMEGGGWYSLFLVKDGELFFVHSETFKRYTDIESGKGWENATMISYFINYVYLVI